MLLLLLGEGPGGHRPSGPGIPPPPRDFLAPQDWLLPLRSAQTWRPPGVEPWHPRARPAGHPDPALGPASRPWSLPGCRVGGGGALRVREPLRGRRRRGPRTPAPIPPAPPGDAALRAHGIPNEFRLMAVEHHVCQAALPPGPLPPPFAKEKRPSRVHPGSNMAAPMFLLLGLSWAELVRLQGAGSLAPRSSLAPLDRPGVQNPRARLSEPQPGSPRLPAVSSNPSGAPSWPARETRSSGPGPRTPATPRRSLPEPQSGLPERPASPRGLRAPRTQRTGTRRGLNSESTSLRSGRGTEGSRAPGPSPRPPTLDSSRGRGSAHARPCAPGPGPFPGHGYSRPTQTLPLLLPVNRPRGHGAHLTVTSTSTAP